MPDVLCDHLLSKYSPGVTEFEEMLTIMYDHLQKIDQKRTARKFVKQVGKKGEEEGEEENPFDRMEDKVDGWEWSWNSEWGSWVCTAVPAAKRQRTEDNPSSSGPPTMYGGYASDSSKGKGKGKSDGKGGNFNRSGR